MDMRVHPSQLVIGCLLTKDVMGKTNRPIVPKNTVLNKIHIRVIQKFLIESVEVAQKLSDGSPFIPEEPSREEQGPSTPKQPVPASSFQDRYLETVLACKQWYNDWRSGAPIDIKQIREVMVPFLEQAVTSSQDIFQLHHFSSHKEYVYHHSVAMGAISGYLALRMGYSKGEWIQIGLAGLLSDSGMTKIDQKLIQKQTPLNESEFEEVKKHPTYSYRFVEKVPSLSMAAKLAVLQHHERLDGSGYPLELNQEKLHPFSQIIAVSDMYHAMTSERIYRKKQSPFKALEEIMKEQFGRYDAAVIQVLVKEMTRYSQGTKIRLSNNRQAEVLFVEPAQPTRPLIRLEEDGQIYALKDYTELHIEEILD